jgi:hypothetical protein
LESLRSLIYQKYLYKRKNQYRRRHSVMTSEVPSEKYIHDLISKFKIYRQRTLEFRYDLTTLDEEKIFANFEEMNSVLNFALEVQKFIEENYMTMSTDYAVEMIIFVGLFKNLIEEYKVVMEFF